MTTVFCKFCGVRLLASKQDPSILWNAFCDACKLMTSLTDDQVVELTRRAVNNDT